MAHFYGGISGKARTDATRLGTEHSGLYAWISGWKSGVTVRASYNYIYKRDEFHIYAGTGSDPSGGYDKLLGMVYLSKNGKVRFRRAVNGCLLSCR